MVRAQEVVRQYMCGERYRSLFAGRRGQGDAKKSGDGGRMLFHTQPTVIRPLWVTQTIILRTYMNSMVRNAPNMISVVKRRSDVLSTSINRHINGLKDIQEGYHYQWLRRL